MPKQSQETNTDTVVGIIEALTDRQSQLDIRLNDLTLRWAGTPFSVQLSGTVTVAVHMRDLTDKEKAAHVAANVAHLRA